MSPAAPGQQGPIPGSAVGGRVRIAYTNACGEASIRVIEPLRIYAGRNGCTYLRAYCHLREEERTFRLDRIRSWEQGGRKHAAVPLTPPATTAPQAATAWPRPVRRRRPFRAILVLALLSLGGRWLVTNAAQEPSPAPEAVRPAPPRHASCRGFEIVGTPSGNGYLYSAPACALSAASQRALHLRINYRLFRQATGIAHPALEELYAGADADRDGYLCWNEIREFQRRLTARYEYRHKATALRPDEFLNQGGGDCEDWALLTCGLLRYWGWEGYVATFFPPGGDEGHALCVVRWKDLLRGFDYYRVEGGITTRDGSPVQPGYYVPIDYHVVGGSSNALERGWALRHFYTPERIYGAMM